MSLVAPLRYLIGADADDPGGPLWAGHPGYVVELPYDGANPQLVKFQREHGAAEVVGYCNLLAEEGYPDRYKPYAKDQSGTPGEWHEGRIDVEGPGFALNINDQLNKWRAAGVAIVEFDNLDSYHFNDCLTALARATLVGVNVVLKNPALVEKGNLLFARTRGCITEAGSGTCSFAHNNRPYSDYPVWFVCNHGEKPWGMQRASVISASKYPNMGVTWCPSSDDYSQAVDLYKGTWT
jgi:hypothetical protein